MTWLITLFNTILTGFSSIVDMLIIVHDKIVEVTSLLEVSQYGIIEDTTMIYKSVEAFRYVIGSYLFNIIITIILFGISYSTYKFIMELKKLLYGDKGALETSGKAGWFTKLFKKKG